MPPAVDDDPSFRFRVDLVELSKRHRAFLQAVHATGLSLTRPSAESFRRYELWLELASKLPEALVPPSDIAWLWHCHRLAPYRYAEHCREIFGKPIEANPPFCMQHAGGSPPSPPSDNGAVEDPGGTARRVWAQMYPGEPFFLPVESAPSPAPTGVGILAGFDVLASAERQSTFLWQVSGHRFEDEEFLSGGLDNYRRFVSLMKHKEKAQVLVPSYQIDLMWHTHILSNFAAYNDDCIELMGTTLNHDDSLNDRSEDSDLERAFAVTQSLWKKTYGVEYFTDGGMYRGEPVAHYYDTSFGFAHLNPVDSKPTTNNGTSYFDLSISSFALASRLRGGAGDPFISVAQVATPVVQAQWVNVDALNIEGSGKAAYIAATDKTAAITSARGTNTNPVMPDYVFGKGSRGASDSYQTPSILAIYP
jgi:hypothetical protein